MKNTFSPYFNLLLLACCCVFPSHAQSLNSYLKCLKGLDETWGNSPGVDLTLNGCLGFESTRDDVKGFYVSCEGDLSFFPSKLMQQSYKVESDNKTEELLFNFTKNSKKYETKIKKIHWGSSSFTTDLTFSQVDGTPTAPEVKFSSIWDAKAKAGLDQYLLSKIEKTYQEYDRNKSLIEFSKRTPQKLMEIKTPIIAALKGCKELEALKNASLKRIDEFEKDGSQKNNQISIKPKSIQQ